MNRFASAIILFVFIIASCSDNSEGERNDLPFKSITFRQVCGWCVAGQNIAITEDQMVRYTKSFPCTPEDNIEKERALSETEIQEINETFNLETLLSIDLNQCGECYDGCDDTITFEGLDGENHSIKYDQFDNYPELEEIKSFVVTLETIRSSF
ncbi:MAG: hypothetical protein P1U56_00705 [Saprospiraceae bacterium]|nr:hypothetical protein [Saprospiraceae bacterium]